MALFEAKVTLPCTPQQVFDFLLRPTNVAEISPPSLGLCFLDPPEVIAKGTRLKFRIQGFGQIREGEHEIVEVLPHTQITENQVRGLLPRWVHDHLFTTNDDGETIVTDRIDFEPPGGVLGLLVTKNRVLDQLEEAFDHRHVQLLKRLATQ
ncbi:MAG: hypothetical protein EHM42_02185 [Planctomycetaceae bacterium]|nr:MAG: hypothetical protein EHM42_02185 [Planctomycetaceae bacterium]